MMDDGMQPSPNIIHFTSLYILPTLSRSLFLLFLLLAAYDTPLITFRGPRS